MTENQWWFILLLIFLVILGLKVVMWLLAFWFIYWLISTGFKKDED